MKVGQSGQKISKNFSAIARIIASVIASISVLSACQSKSDTSSNRQNTALSSTSSTASTMASGTADTNLTQSAVTANSVPSKTAVVASALAATASPNPKPQDNSLTIYTSQDPKSLTPLFNEYKQRTNITIKVVSDTPDALIARLKNEEKNTPADLLLTQDIGTFWQAKQAALIQPFTDEKINIAVPERFRDSSGEWAGLGYYARTAVYDSRVLNANDISSYADLAKPKWSHKLCMTTSKQVANQSLIVSLLQNLGDKKTQAILQGWVSNFAMPPLADDKALLNAIATGQCQIGLVNSDSYGNYVEKNPNTPVKQTWINKGYGGVHVNVVAAAIPKFAKHPDLALALIEWLSAKDQQSWYASLNQLYPLHKTAEASVLLKSWGELEPSNVAVKVYGDKQKDALEQIKIAEYR